MGLNIRIMARDHAKTNVELTCAGGYIDRSSNDMENERKDLNFGDAG